MPLLRDTNGKATRGEQVRRPANTLLIEVSGKRNNNERACILKRVLNKIAFAWAILMAVTCFTARGQDTVGLKEVGVVTQRTSLSSIGKKTTTIDSTTKQQFVFNSVGDILNLNTPVFIKNYGPGGLSTSAFRGGNASQTAVTWNGFNIQNGMLGQIDFSLLPSVLFDNITIEYGGSSSLWGSGAVGGSIHLNNKPLFDRGLTTIANLSVGSFGLFNASAKVDYSKKKFATSTKAYLQNSLNNYYYTDSSDHADANKRLQHATYAFSGIMQELKCIINQKQTIAANVWFNKGNRQIPTFNATSLSKPEQFDANLKTSVNWNYVSNRFNSSIRSAWFYDHLDYTDSAYSIYSKSKLQTLIAENENIFRWRENNSLNLGANFTAYSGMSDGYRGAKSLQKAAFFAGNKFSIINNKLMLYVSLRTEYFSTAKTAITGNTALEYAISRQITAKVNAAKVYRQPTLNELYWTPGGNPSLLPEEGYTYEGDLSYKKQFGHVHLFISGSAYMRTITNWILWLPSPAGSTPVNIQEVFSRGTETHSRLSWQKNKTKLSLGIVSGYVLSTVKSSRQENDNTQSRQLIYTPRYTINGNISFTYSKFTLTAYHQYVGYRFTTSDNLQWLTPYHYTSVRANFQSNVQPSANMTLFFACNNVFNTNYAVIAGRYMPLRNFEIGITLKTNKPNKTKGAEK